MKGVGDLKSIDTSHGDVEFAIFPADCWSIFGSVFPHMLSFVFFGTVMYILWHCMLALFLNFDFIGDNS